MKNLTQVVAAAALILSALTGCAADTTAVETTTTDTIAVEAWQALDTIDPEVFSAQRVEYAGTTAILPILTDSNLAIQSENGYWHVFNLSNI